MQEISSVKLKKLFCSDALFLFCALTLFFHREDRSNFHLCRLRCSSGVHEVNVRLFEISSEEIFSKLDFSVVSNELVRVAEVMRHHVLQRFIRVQISHYGFVLRLPFQQDYFSHSRIGMTPLLPTIQRTFTTALPLWSNLALSTRRSYSFQILPMSASM
jgi:hypothetical protein